MIRSVTASGAGLFLRVGGRALHLLDLERGRRTQWCFASRVLGVQAGGQGETWVLAAPSSYTEAGRVWAFEDGSWRALAPFPSGPVDERALALLEGRHALRVLTETRLLTLEPTGTWSALPVKLDRRGEDAVIASSSTNDSVYVGFNRGEWGGGVVRIALRTGEVHLLRRVDKGEVCGYPLDGACDPVNALIPDPERPACVLAGIGFEHLGMGHGRVLRLCGDQVEVAFERGFRAPFGAGACRIGREEGPECQLIDMSESIWGLHPDESLGYWILTSRALYHHTRSSTAEVPMPEDFVSVAGVSLSRTLPGMVIVNTMANNSFSVSGSTPLLAVWPPAR